MINGIDLSSLIPYSFPNRTQVALSATSYGKSRAEF